MHVLIYSLCIEGSVQKVWCIGAVNIIVKGNFHYSPWNYLLDIDRNP